MFMCSLGVLINTDSQTPSPVAALELELSDPRASGMGVAVATDIGFICAVQYGSH